jgi:hypothetical protein
MKDAITKAIEGGWKMSETETIYVANNIPFVNDSFLLDPLFWSALGKSLGWEVWDKKALEDSVAVGGKIKYWWQIMWHRFIDHLAEGKDADSFFTNLLPR